MTKPETLLKDAGAVLFRTLGEEHPRTLRNMNNLGVLYGRMGRHQDAYEVGVRTLELRERILGPMHREDVALDEQPGQSPDGARAA